MPTLTPQPTTALLTLDEAYVAIVRSALQCLEHATCRPDQLLDMLWARPRRWGPHDQAIADHHHHTLDLVTNAGYSWVIPYQLEGIISATGLDQGNLDNLDLLAAQLPEHAAPD